VAMTPCVWHVYVNRMSSSLASISPVLAGVLPFHAIMVSGTSETAADEQTKARDASARPTPRNPEPRAFRK
jgi:hypothetical protein